MRTWLRCTPHRRTTDLAPGLAAAVADPLWFLLRQWQLGELAGDDGGSPVAVDFATSWSPLTRLRPEGTAPSDPVPLDGAGPVERLVERVAQIHPDAPERTGWVAAVHAGRSLHRLLAALDPGLAERVLSVPELLFTAETEVPVESASDRAYRTLLAGRVIDGARALAYLDAHGGGLPDAVRGGVDPAAVSGRLEQWREEVEREWGVGPAGGRPPAWVDDRLEYAFSIGGPALPPPGDGGGGADGEFVLAAREYDGCGLSWYSVDADVDPSRALGAGDDGSAADRRRCTTVVPAPLEYPGMPADRYWEIEDARVSLGAMSAGPTDLVRMFAVDFAMVYSPDWFVVPVELPVGCVGRIDWVVVRDTFSAATVVGGGPGQGGAVQDGLGQDGAGRLFRTGPVGGGPGGSPGLIVLQSPLGTLVSTPSEEVALQRDEAANMAWAIETTVPDAGGRGMDQRWSESDFLPAPARGEPSELVWRLASDVAEAWTPLVPGCSGAYGSGLLVPAALLGTRTGVGRAARGRIVAGIRAGVHDEEVPETGVIARTVDQYARSHDGRTWVWRGIEKRAGRGSADAGLRFDTATPR